MSYRMICRWVAKFRRGQQQLKNATHTGRPEQQQLKVLSKKSAISYKKMPDSQ